MTATTPRMYPQTLRQDGAVDQCARAHELLWADPQVSAGIARMRPRE